MTHKLIAVGIVISAAIVTNIPSTVYAGDFRKEYGEPAVKAGCEYIGGPVLKWGCGKVLETGKDGFKSRRYPPPQQQTYQGGGGPPQYGDPAYSPPAYAPPPLAYASPPPAYAPPPPVVWGQFCQTNMGVVGPGRPKPVGSPCSVDTHWGRIFGRMI
jgi:hypothetical protein